MLKNIILLLIPLLISSKCARVDVALTCKQIRSAKINSLPTCDTSFKFNRCRVRCFNLTDYRTVPDWECGQDFKSGDYPLEYCEGCAGFYVDDWPIEVRPKIKKLKNLYRNLCRR